MPNNKPGAGPADAGAPLNTAPTPAITAPVPPPPASAAAVPPAPVPAPVATGQSVTSAAGQPVKAEAVPAPAVSAADEAATFDEIKDPALKAAIKHFDDIDPQRVAALDLDDVRERFIHRTSDAEVIDYIPLLVARLRGRTPETVTTAPTQG
jgi:hypothetical protein